MNGIRIEQISGTRHFKIFLDDKEISNIVTGISIVLDIHDVPRVHLSIVPHKIDMPDELLALVTAGMDKLE